MYVHTDSNTYTPDTTALQILEHSHHLLIDVFLIRQQGAGPLRGVQLSL